MGDVPKIPAAGGWWQTVTFYVDGFFACLLKGKMHVYSSLVAQARLETSDMTNTGWNMYGNPFSMHVGKGSSRRDGQVDYDGGAFATYSGFGRMWRAWNDRLDWDVQQHINPDLFGNDYKNAVLQGGYLGVNPDKTRVASYMAAWKSKEDSNNVLLKALQGVGITVVKAGAIGRYSLVVGIVVLVIWLLWNWYNGRSRVAPAKQKKHRLGVRLRR